MIRRNTYQRSVVLDAVRKLACHATADEVYKEAKTTCPTISRATVYRNLQQLYEMGEICKREIPGSPDRYDHLTTDHCHVRCSVCGAVSDVETTCIPDMLEKVEDPHGFAIDACSVVFSGVCPECQKNASKA